MLCGVYCYKYQTHNFHVALEFNYGPFASNLVQVANLLCA